MKKQLQWMMVSLALAGTTAMGQPQVRNAVGSDVPRHLLDGLIATSWSSAAAGESAGFLLEDPMMADSLVAASDAPGESGYRLLGSMNYRDWTILGEGQGVDAESVSAVETFNPEEVQYVRFINLDNGPVGWELLTGQQADVEAQLALLQPVEWGDITDPGVILQMADLAFDWQVARETTRQDGTGWVNGAFYTGVGALYASTGGDKYRQAILDKGAFANWTLRLRTSNKTFYHADDHCLGQSWLELYLLDPNPSPVWIVDVKNRIDMVVANPLQGRVDYNWCDSLYMSPPLYGRLAALTGDNSYQTFIDEQWWDSTDFLYDTEHHLYYRDASYFDDREPNGMPVFWSRGNGWVIGGLVRMLQYMPLDWPERPSYVTLLQEMSSALAAIQGDDGLWSSSLLYPEKYNLERETSGSAFFTYAMAWGINEGILDATTYGPVIEKAWQGLAGMLNADGTLQFIQQVGAGPALNNGLYTDKDYGYGAFILAGTEMMRYYAAEPAAFKQLLARQAIASPTGEQLDAATWTAVDTFEGGFTWTEIKDVSNSVQLVNDPFDGGGSRVYSIYTGNRTPGIHRATTAIPPVAEGTVATVYQRFAFDNPEVDVVFGLSDLALVDDYNDYESGFRIHFALNQAEVRDGGSYGPIGEDLMQLQTWYEVWTVFNNANDTYDVYIRGGSNYPQQTLLKSGIAFRNGTVSSLKSYALSYNTDYCEGTFYLDDLHIDTSGVTLTRPETVRQTVYSPWSNIGRRQAGGMKLTPAGILWDEYFPWIYHGGLASWCYIWPQDTYPGGYWGWSATSSSWIWLPHDAFGWYYGNASGDWHPFGA
jgi:rhamnogalacturonyl hydrolase YesR